MLEREYGRQERLPTHLYMAQVCFPGTLTRVAQCLFSRVGCGGFWVQLLRGQGARVVLVLCEYIWNAPAVLAVLPTFNDTGSLGSPPLRLVYLSGFTLGDRLPFPCGE